MFKSQLAVTPDGLLLCASGSACALYGIDTPQALIERARPWLDQASIRSAIAAGVPPSPDGVMEIHSHDALRLQLRSIPGGGALRLGVLIDLLHNDANLIERQREIDRAHARLHEAEEQLLQSDKMASIGQLAAGVAHEINNPIGYVYSNLGTLDEYVANLLRVINAYEKALRMLPVEFSERRNEVSEIKQQIDYEFLIKDLPSLLSESREGIERVRKIVQDLRDFSRAGYDEQWTMADLHRGLESTLNIVWNDLKYKCEITREFGDIPPVECLPSQLNQVFLNILVNAGHAIEGRGTIRIATGRDNDGVFVEIHDSGKGIAPDHLQRIFDPFFTTKPIGQGTGLGLSLSYSIIRKHHGRIDVHSALGRGTKFRIHLPLQQPAAIEALHEGRPPQSLPV